jgi:hypothetical protein
VSSTPIHAIYIPCCGVRDFRISSNSLARIARTIASTRLDQRPGKEKTIIVAEPLAEPSGCQLREVLPDATATYCLPSTR